MNLRHIDLPDAGLTPHHLIDALLPTDEQRQDIEWLVDNQSDLSGLVVSKDEIDALIAVDDDLLALAGYKSDIDALIAVDDDLLALAGYKSDIDDLLSWLYDSSSDLYLKNAAQDKDLYLQVNDGGVTKTALFIDAANARLGIWETSPQADAHIAGMLWVQATSATLPGYFYNPTDQAGAHGLKVETKNNSQSTMPFYASVNGTVIYRIRGDRSHKYEFATEDLEIFDAGSAGATEQDWIRVAVGGNTGYIRVYASK